MGRPGPAEEVEEQQQQEEEVEVRIGIVAAFTTSHLRQVLLHELSLKQQQQQRRRHPHFYRWGYNNRWAPGIRHHMEVTWVRALLSQLVARGIVSSDDDARGRNMNSCGDGKLLASVNAGGDEPLRCVRVS